MMRQRLLLGAPPVLFVLLFGFAAQSEGQVRVMNAVRRTGPVIIDARLDDSAWVHAPVAGQFTQSYPNQDQPAVDPTEVRVLYDNDALYVGVRMFDAHPDSIAAQLARRDASGIYSDWVHVLIDSYHDRRTAFRFTVNPRGVQKDVYTSNDGDEDINWDAVWEVGTRVDSLGWVAEFRIPLSQLRFGSAPPNSSRTWGIQVMRDVARRNERDAWSPWTRQSAGFVSAFGDLIGLQDVPAPKRLEILPYASSKLTRAPGAAGDPFYHQNDMQPSLGADLRVGLPKGLTLTATVNPDFGQVEVDPAVVNLSAYETFFPEKRPFFLEGSDAFSFGQVRRQNDFGGQYFFYSRRIGRAPQLGPLGSGSAYVDMPTQTTIAGAAKVTGRSGPWSIGILNALTTKEAARVASAAGVQSKTPVEPLSNYFAARLKRDFLKGNSFVGGMVTSTVRSMSDSVFSPRLRAHATLAGVDFEHGIRKRAWIVSGFASATRVVGSRAAIALTQRNSTHYYQRPDAGYLTFDSTRTSLLGHMAEIALQKNGSVFGSLALKEVSPGFELNDFGFLNHGDYVAASSLLGYQNSRAGKRLRDYTAFVYHNAAWNFGRNTTFNSLNASGNVTFNNLWQASLNLGREFETLNDRLLRGGPLALAPAGWNLNANVFSDSRRPVIIGLGGSRQTDAAGGDYSSVTTSFDMRPATNVHITLAPRYAVNRVSAQYLAGVADVNAAATYGARYVFAQLDQRTLSMDMRVEWTFTPMLSLQTYVQPFVSAGAYTHFMEFVRPRTFDFDVYGVDRGSISYVDALHSYRIDPDGSGPSPAFSLHNPDFNVRSLRGNAVLRWEYRPGSAIFLVWQQQRSGFAPIGEFDFGRDADAIFRTRPTNVFLLKATWWIGH